MERVKVLELNYKYSSKMSAPDEQAAKDTLLFPNILTKTMSINPEGEAIARRKFSEVSKFTDTAKPVEFKVRILAKRMHRLSLHNSKSM